MLIRSSKVNKEPFLLAARNAAGSTNASSVGGNVLGHEPENKTARRDPHAHVPGEASNVPGEISEPMTLPQHELEGASAGVAIAALSYAEYKERFKQELETMKDTAVQQGYREGEELARQQAEEEYGEKIRALSALITAARAALDQGLDQLHEIGAEIAFEAVLKILGDTVVTREGVLAVVRQVTRRAKDTTRLTVRLSPADLDLLGDAKTALLDGFTNGEVEIFADERVALGGCLLETPAGNLDGRLEVQLQCFRDALQSTRIRRSDRSVP